MIVLKGTRENYLDYMFLKSRLARHEGQYYPVLDWTEMNGNRRLVSQAAMDDLDREDSAVYLAYDDPGPVGFLALSLGSYMGIRGKTGIIAGAYIDPEYRSKAAPKLWEKVKAWFVTKGVDRVQFKVVDGNEAMDPWISHRATPIGHIYEMGLNHGRRIRSRLRTEPDQRVHEPRSQG